MSTLRGLSQHIERWNVKANPIYGEDTIVIGLVGDTGAVDKDALMLDPQVENIIKVQEPFKLANREFHPDNSVVEITPGVVVGGKKLVVMAGPCSVEERGADHRGRQGMCKKAGANVLRGGAFKPRTSPYAFQGLRRLRVMELLLEGERRQPVFRSSPRSWIRASPRPLHGRRATCIQVGARNMQNFELLKELGKTKQANPPQARPREHHDRSSSMSAEYIMAGGNEKVILCERGIRTYETYTRNTLDISAVPVLQAHQPSAGHR